MDMRNFYAGSSLDRATHRRGDEDWLRARLARPGARLIPVWRNQNLVIQEPETELAAINAASFPGAADLPIVVWLGSDGRSDYYAVDLSHVDDPKTHPAVPETGSFEDLRRVGPILRHDDGAMLAYARGLIYWHDRHRFCGACGAPTQSQSGGHSRVCTSDSCGVQHFPRTDPAVIVLVHDGADRIILGRTPRFLSGMHSVLAGFVEPGESLEDTVRREIAEEVNVAVTDIRYHSSQPWPFPSSLMIGFTARATTFDVRPDLDELESAAWYTRAELLASPEDESFRLPRRDSIARRLINEWLRKGSA